MADSSCWADNCVHKRCTAEDAIRRIRPGQRVFIGSSCGEPQFCHHHGGRHDGPELPV